MIAAPPINRRWFVAVCLALVLGTIVLYAPIAGHPFIHYDDYEYIVENSHVNSGLSWTNVAWSFDHKYAGNWHPLTWISHMLDCQFFGLEPAGHHLVNVLFHAVNALLLFLFLSQTTGAFWRSALVAAFFAWHPLRVESVAWAAERKDVLSAFFWLLTLLAYSRYAKRPNLFRYLLTLLFFACGLLSKPMVVTLPFVLLLLDFWPLNRLPNYQMRWTHLKPLLWEKLPLLALAVAASAITFYAQSGAFWSLENLPVRARAGNALVAYLDYISKILWPSHLALIYSHPHHWPLLLAAGSGLLLMLWTGIVVWRRTAQPYLFTGWFWFLGTLVPVIGLVQVGVQSIADRYTYLPSIGLFIAIVWTVGEFIQKPRQKSWVVGATGVALAACLVVTSIQIRYWQSDLKLFAHAVAVTTDNYAAEICLGEALERAGDQKDAYACYADALRIEPDYPLAQFKAAMMAIIEHRPDEAYTHFEAATKLMPGNPDLRYDFGIFLAQQGHFREAAEQFRIALKDRPGFSPAQRELSALLAAHPDSR